jgi:PAS domain S-box-containing protein
MEKDVIIKELEKKVDHLEKDLAFHKDETVKVKRTIWNMLNYANMFVLVLDKDMKIKFINWSLARALGFETEEEPIGKCWLKFINKKEKQMVTNLHSLMAKEKDEHVNEFTNDIVRSDGTSINVKWFNIHINNDYNWTFSIGLLTKLTPEITEESVRSYYRDIIEQDKTMIRSMRDTILSGLPCEE